MKFEPDRARLNIPDPCEQEGRQQFTISKAVVDAGSDFFEQFVARSVFEETDEWLEVGVELDDSRVEPRFLGGNAGQAGGEGQVTQSVQRGSGQGGFEKTPAAGSSIHSGRF